MFVVFGLLVGFVARAIMPGTQGMGVAMTALLGMTGSLVGGAVGAMLVGHSVLELHTSGVIGSLLGALVVLALFGFAGRSRAVV